MSEPIDVRKYNFINMPLNEHWGAFVPTSSTLAKKDYITPKDLIGMEIITATGDFNQSKIGKWFGDYIHNVKILATANLPYNEAVLAKENIGVMLSLNLNCTYENLHFIPLHPSLKVSTALAWKKEQIFPPSTTEFIDFAKKYIKSISNNEL